MEAKQTEALANIGGGFWYRNKKGDPKAAPLDCF